MSSYLCALILFLLFNSVFDFTPSESTPVSVTEGDSVTLNTDVTEIQRNDQIIWFYSLNSSETRFAEIYKQDINMFDNNVMFGDRLKMDSQTGSLTITNIRTEHSGLYKLQIIRNRTNVIKRFKVSVYVPLTSHFPFVLISLSAVILVICAVVFHLYNRNTSGREDEKSVSEYTQVVYRLHVGDLPSVTDHLTPSDNF